MKTRIEYIDIERSIAIIFVVMGHVIQYNLGGNAADRCFDFIYSFHMGFFFFVSGCTASITSGKNTWGNFVQFIQKKAKQLLIPFFVWGGVIVLIANNLSLTEFPNRILEIIKYPDHNAPWFIIELFFIQLVYFICCALNMLFKGRRTILWILFVLSVPSVVIVNKFVGNIFEGAFAYINWIYLLLFYIGHIMQTQEINNEKTQGIIAFGGLVVFIALQSSFSFSDKSLLNMVLKGVLSLVFSICAHYSVRIACDIVSKDIKKTLNFIGKHTLEIYVTHYYIVIVFPYQWIATTDMYAVPLFMIVLVVVLTFVIPLVLLLSETLKNIPFLSLLLYGKSSNAKTNQGCN